VKIEDALIYFDPQQKCSFISGCTPDVCAKFRENLVNIRTVKARTDTYRGDDRKYVSCSHAIQ